MRDPHGAHDRAEGPGPAGGFRSPIGQLVRMRRNYDFGVASVVAIKGPIAEIIRPSEERQQCSRTELMPAILAPGMVCALRDTSEFVKIRSVHGNPQSDLRTLVVAKFDSEELDEITEDAIRDIRSSHVPIERLLQLDHRGRHTLLAREALLRAYLQVQSDCRGLENLAGARIRLLPHQLMTAQRVLSFPAPRALLGDEVGLGKTIECGMVLSVLMHYKPDLRVLVLCPGPLCLQWFCEMYNRFHARVFSLAEQHRESNLAKLPRIIASFAAVQRSDGLRATLAEIPWDVVVIDEAHRIAAGSPIFSFVHGLATRVRGLILLSATPVRARAAEYTRLLSLLNPLAFSPDDTARLEKLRPLQQAIADLSLQTEGAGPQVLPRRAKSWLELLGEDENIKGWAAEMTSKGRGATAARDALLHYVAEWYCTDSRVIRNRREGISDHLPMPKRTLTPLPYEMSEAEKRVAAFACEWCALLSRDAQRAQLQVGQFIAAQALQFLASGSGALGWLLAERRKGLGAQEPLSSGLAGAIELPLSQIEIRQFLSMACRQLPPRAGEEALLDDLEEWLALWHKDEQRLAQVCNWVLSQLEKRPRDKLLLFAEQPETLQALQQRLSLELGRRRLRIVGFHVGMSPEERERAANHFSKLEGTAILLCDQLGGEGRNFQAASWVVHVDLPWDIGAIEQRIGRLDRIGRDEEVRILSISSYHFIERSWADLLWREVSLGQRTLAGLEFLAEEMQREFIAQATAGKEAPLLQWHATAGARIEQERQRQAEDNEKVLDRQRFLSEDSEEFVEELQKDSQLDFALLSDWARKADIQIKQTREPNIYDIDISGQTRPVVKMKAERVRCTPDRDLALDDSSLQFLTWGHPVVEALHDDGQNYTAARCAHVVHKDDAGRTWRGCRIRVIIQANPQFANDLPASLKGRVNYIARQIEETLFVRGDGQVESDAKQKEWLESAFAKSHNPDYLALAADESAYEQFTVDVQTAARAGLEYVRQNLLSIFVSSADELAEDQDLKACQARQRAGDGQQADEASRLAAQMLGLYENALRSIREPLVEIDNISFLNIMPRVTTGAMKVPHP